MGDLFHSTEYLDSTNVIEKIFYKKEEGLYFVKSYKETIHRSKPR